MLTNKNNDVKISLQTNWEVVIMSDILLNDKELRERDEILLFIASLKPEIFEKLKTIIWWESLKEKEPTRQDTKGA